MKVAIISDIHGNRHALEAVLTDIADTPAEQLWCLGDLVGYGADPDECVALTREHAALCLAGNHDLAVLGEIPVEDFSPAAGIAVRWTREAISGESRDYLATLSSSAGNGEIGLYHASPRDPVWEYVLSAAVAELCLDAQPHRVCLVGHSHVALSFDRPSGGVSSGELRRAGDSVDFASGEWLFNPGSVGQPRDGDARAAWMMLDLDDGTATYRRCDYNIEAAAAAIRAARLPESLAERLVHGQ
jgi:predicted phosphodiesterase